jgi:hypothetical protein
MKVMPPPADILRGMAIRRFTLAATFTTLLLGGAFLAGCSSDDETRISPVPAGYAALLRQQRHSEGTRRDHTEGGRKLDELLAVVDGEVLTRREVLRSLRLSEKEGEDPDVEEEILGARLEWAKQRLIMGAARRAGLRIPESAIDKIVDQQLQAEMDKNEETTDEKLTQEDYLLGRRLTRKEYRDQIYGAVVAEYYMRKLYEGVGPARPDMDNGVSPAEVRRIYYEHRKKFDQPPGVKIALFQLPIAMFEKDGVDFLESEKRADDAASNLAGALRRGGEPKALAKELDLPPAAWQQPPGFIGRFPEPRGNKWLFADERRANDAIVFTDPAGPIILAVTEVQPAEQRTLADPEVYDLIVQMLQGARRKQLRARLTVDLLNRGGVVWPEALSDELLDDAQAELDLIAAHEIIKKARLR